MPVGKEVRYRVVTTKRGKKVRLAIRGGSAKKKTGRVIEAKNLETGSTHEPGEFVQERKRAKSSRLRRTSFRRLFGR